MLEKIVNYTSRQRPYVIIFILTLMLSKASSVPDKLKLNETSSENLRRKRIAIPQLPNSQGFDDLSRIRQNPFETNARRNEILSALEQRIQERNLLLRQSNLMRENELLREKQLLHRPLLSENGLLDRKSSIYNNVLFSRPSDPLLLENQLDNPSHRALSEELRSHPELLEELNTEGNLADDSLLQRDHLYPKVGNLGDETIPYGSLGEMRNYIPLGRLDDQLLPSEEMTDIVPAEPIPRHKEKKTWVTDVNVYSKKKKLDDINELFANDDNDPLDEYDPCDGHVCRNGGLCKVVGNTEFMCICPRTFKGKHCEVRNHCHPNPCAHGSTCTETNPGFKCTCSIGFKGTRCKERNLCLPNPCENEGVCTESTSSNGFSCVCKNEWIGRSCDKRKTPCFPNPCHNNGHCLTDGSTFQCSCIEGTNGKYCEQLAHDSDNSLETMATMLHVDQNPAFLPTQLKIQEPNHILIDENAVSKSVIASHPFSTNKFPCAVNPCFHGICITDTSRPSGHRCDCSDGYSGPLCKEKSCKCENEGVCVGDGLEKKCVCKPGYGGSFCSEHIQCNDNTCMHGGICIEQVGGFKCKCDNGYKGKRCEEIDKCQPNPCLHDGVCRSFGIDLYQCDCKQRFKGKNCEEIDFCASSPCHNGGECFGYPGGYQCECLPGYRGKICDLKVHCLSSPCSNGAECIEVLPTPEQPDGAYKCGCKSGFMGPSCEDEDFCHQSPCQHGGTCTNFRDGFICSCSVEYHGDVCQHINHCYGSPCKNNGKCISGTHDFKCDCASGFKGVLCEDIDYCDPNPCKNGGYCAANEHSNGFVCHCTEGFRGLTCSETNACFPNPCSHGDCKEIAGGFMCNCTRGFKGPKCGELNHCDPNPCFHNGICVEINGGSGFVCQCPKGYQGEKCDRKDLCHPNPCEHDGICRRLSFEKRYTETSSSDDDIQCLCSKGYRGRRCSDVDPCFPNPCLHNSVCLSHEKTGTTSCNCSMGWKGEQCQLLDLCSPDPCRYGTHCIQTDEESYQCVKNLCQPNPCLNAGKCVVVNNDEVECACPKAWKGKRCEVKDVCSPNPCLNEGICRTDWTGEFSCQCSPPFSGRMCDAKKKAAVLSHSEAKNFCMDMPCKNSGTCMNKEGGFFCRCREGFQGPFCEETVCDPSPCSNGGTCIPYYGIALCKCSAEFTGAHCSAIRNKPLNKWKDVYGVTKSIMPHVNTLQSVRSDVIKTKTINPPYRDLVEKVVEILSNDNDKTEIIQSVPAVHQNVPQLQPFINQNTSLKSSAMSRNNVMQQYKQDLCMSANPCKNNASCILRNNGEMECICPSGFSGPLCADVGNMGYSSAPKFFPQDECNHCDVNAICVNGHCICEQGYVGDGLECWVKTVEDEQWKCEINPCENGGTCKNGRAQCVCRLGYVGKFCEKYCPPAVHLSFDAVRQSMLMDESGNNNNALLKNGAVLVNQGKCDSAVALQGGDIYLDGMNFHPKPRESITIALWMKLDSIYGTQSIFDTVGGSMSNHSDGQYHLEINNGKVRWFHRNEIHVTIFDVRGGREIEANKWVHVVGTYDGYKRIAKLFMDGDVVGEYRNTGSYWELSQDWQIKAGLGKHLHKFGNRLLRGMVDEFFIFDCALPRLEILVLMHHCKVYFKNNKGKQSQLSVSNQKQQIQQQIQQRQQQLQQEMRQQIYLKQQPQLQYLHNQPQQQQQRSAFNYNSLLLNAFPVKDQKPFQNYLRFDAKESTFGTEIKENMPGNFPPNNLKQIWKEQTASRKSLVPKIFPQYRPMPNMVLGPSAYYLRNSFMRDFQGNRRTSIPRQYYPQINPKTSIMTNIKQPYFHKETQPQVQINQPSFYLQPFTNYVVKQMQTERARSREHINGPSTLFSQIPPTANSYMGIERPDIQQRLLQQQYINRQNLQQQQQRQQQQYPQTSPQHFNHQPYSEQSSSANKGNVESRWFSWTQGLAQTSGKTHTTTHSNSLQKNDPGVVSTDTHVQSSQGSQSDTNVKQMYDTLAVPFSPKDMHGFDMLKDILSKQQITDPNLIITNSDRNIQLEQNPDRRQAHTTVHNHQWGYGNGNGKGHGIGFPGASGSGGGWGTGGPITQGMNMPAWDGGKPPEPQNQTPSTSQPEQENPAHKNNLMQTLQNIAMTPPSKQTMDIWNAYLSEAARKRQSISNAQAGTNNDASSGISITPTNGNNVYASNHHWGFGNGNGAGNGAGSPGGEGHGGGWGTGGPTQTNIQVHNPNQRTIDLINFREVNAPSNLMNRRMIIGRTLNGRSYRYGGNFLVNRSLLKKHRKKRDISVIK